MRLGPKDSGGEADHEGGEEGVDVASGDTVEQAIAHLEGPFIFNDRR